MLNDWKIILMLQIIVNLLVEMIQVYAISSRFKILRIKTFCVMAKIDVLEIARLHLHIFN